MGDSTDTFELFSMPLETLMEILKRTEGFTLGKCRRVCKKWKNVIDGTDVLWRQFCEQDFRIAAKIAKIKSGNDIRWYHIYKNLVKWTDISKNNLKLTEFYKFTLHDKSHALGVDYGVLPLKDAKGVMLYDMCTLKYIPVAIADRNCMKISNNDNVTIVLLKSGLLLHRTEDVSCMSDIFYKADNYVLAKDALYFFNNRDVFKCDLVSKNLNLKLLLHCQYDIKEIQYNKGILYLFTDCGKIVSIDKYNQVNIKPINIPVEWIKHIKYITAIDDRNFVCYSRNLFKIETDDYQHLYLDFPPITALFFYGDIVLIGTKTGEIQLYRLSSQKKAVKPIFENLAVLPEGKFAVQLDVCEKKTGPIIIISTFFEIFILDGNFFPHEQETKKSFPAHKLSLYKRLLKVRDRLQSMANAGK